MKLVPKVVYSIIGFVLVVGFCTTIMGIPADIEPVFHAYERRTQSMEVSIQNVWVVDTEAGVELKAYLEYTHPNGFAQITTNVHASEEFNSYDITLKQGVEPKVVLYFDPADKFNVSLYDEAPYSPVLIWFLYIFMMLASIAISGFYVALMRLVWVKKQVPSPEKN